MDEPLLIAKNAARGTGNAIARGLGRGVLGSLRRGRRETPVMSLLRFPARAVATALSTMLGLAASSVALHAQTDEHRGPALVIAGPSTVGVKFPLTKRLALRPDLSLTRATFKVSATESKFVNLSVGLSVLIALSELDGLQTYAAPRIAISRNTFDNGSFTDLWFFDLAVGAAVPLTKRVAIFGEVGPRVTYTDQSTPGVVDRTTNLVGRSALGATLAF